MGVGEAPDLDLTRGISLRPQAWGRAAWELPKARSPGKRRHLWAQGGAVV